MGSWTGKATTEWRTRPATDTMHTSVISVSMSPCSSKMSEVKDAFTEREYNIASDVHTYFDKNICRLIFLQSYDILLS